MDGKSKKSRILIVDDAPENIRILGDALKGDHRISFAVNGREALGIARSDNVPDLILLDIVMPEMDGYEVCRQLKAGKKTRNIPVIFITAKSDEEDETKGLGLGAVDYITKPFSKAIVKARVRTHLELKRHRDILENLSSMDGLTGIPNRRRFDESLSTEWKAALREGEPLSIIMIDIDFFGAYNNTYGHLAGDDCLKKVAGTLADSVNRPMDFLGRYGGEEFSAILPKTDMEGAVYVAEEMRKNVEGLRIRHENSLVSDWVTVSLGAAVMTPAAEFTPAALIEGGDEALYQAKKEGRNRVRSIDLNGAARV